MEYEDLLNTFNAQFLKNENMQEWYSLGIDLVLKTDSIIVKEEILSKMLLVFPKNYELYYYMGCIYKNTRPYIALSWFRTCFRFDPKNVENILDYVQTLFNLNMISYILKWDEENNRVLQRTRDLRIMFIYATVRIKMGDLGNGLISYNHIMEHIHQIPESNIIFVYLNYAFLLSKLGYMRDLFLSYNNLILPWLNKNENENFLQSPEAKHAIKSLYHNYILVFDYTYYNINQRYSLCRQVYNKLYGQRQGLLTYTHQKTHVSFLNISNPIHIGYVSSDFQEHAVSNFILPIIFHHSPLFKVHLFTQKTLNKSLFKERKDIIIHEIQFLTDDECAKLIYETKIDILFDLNGYTDGNRLGVFARRPSPIQVSYLGYPNSLCVDFIQYRITDMISDPKDTKQIHNETYVYLPKCFLLFQSILQSSPVQRLAKDPTKPVVFGSLNKELKNNTTVLSAWATILARVPNSQIIIKIDSNDMYESRLHYYSRELCVEPSRVQIICKCSDTEYIELFGQIDILLDTFPYSGTTTTCNALYNNVPTITLYSRDYHCHNVSSSLLINSGLGDFVAYSMDEYIEKSVSIATRISGLDSYNIHEKFMKLMDVSAFMENYENLLVKVGIKGVGLS